MDIIDFENGMTGIMLDDLREGMPIAFIHL